MNGSKLNRVTLLSAAAVSFSGGIQPAFAQDPMDRLSVGPIAVTQAFNGVAVNAQVTSTFSITTHKDGLYLDARLEADLSDLQAKFAGLVDTFPLPKDNCGSYSADNPVVTLNNKALIASASLARIVLAGDVKVWDCRENPIPESYWDPVGGHMRVPSIRNWQLVWDDITFGVMKFRKGSPIKNVLLTQPFDISIPVSLRKTGERTAGLVVGDPSVELGGQYSWITKKVLSLARVDLNAEAKKALDASIDPTKLIASIPAKYAELSPTLQSVSFKEQGGKLSAEIALSAKIPQSKLNALIEALINGKKADL